MDAPACGWVRATDHQRMTRWHTADGRATKTVVHLDFRAALDEPA